MNKTLLFSGVSAFALVLGMSAPTLADGEGAWALINVHLDEKMQLIDADSTVTGNLAVDNGSTRSNDVTNSYGGAAGIAHVQQNEGSSNAIQAATAVHANMTGNGPVSTGAVVFSTTVYNWTINEDGTRDNLVSGSFNDFSGVATVQQNNGDNNEIGAATAVHTNNGGFGDVSQLALAHSFTGEQNGDGDVLYDFNSDRNNTINPSFNNASGIATVQQNNGNGNAISAATAVTGNVGSGDVDQVALAVGGVGWNVHNHQQVEQNTIDFGLDRDNLIDSSFTGYAGIATVQQNNGDANAMSVATAVAGNLGPGNNAPNGTLNNDVTQLVGTIGVVAEAYAGDWDSVEFVDEDDDPNTPDTPVYRGFRDNTILNSFGGASGVASVQQNNGSNNVMNIANAVQGNLNTGPVGSLDGSDDVTQVSVTVGGTAKNNTWEKAFALTPPPSHRENLIEGSFNDYAGIATVQQNNGDNNVIGASSAVVANHGSGDKTDNVTFSAAGTLGSVWGNRAWDGTDNLSGANRENMIDPSFQNAHGIISVQQNNGNNNVMGVANAVVANVDNDDGAAGNVNNGAGGAAFVGWDPIHGDQGNTASDHVNTDRVNNISGGSFDGASGVMTVQQNNGDNNVMGASNAIAVDVNDEAGFSGGLSVAALGAVVSGNTTIVNSTSGAPGYLNTIDSSFVGATGVMTVQQNNGSNNAIQSAIAVTANF